MRYCDTFGGTGRNRKHKLQPVATMPEYALLKNRITGFGFFLGFFYEIAESNEDFQGQYRVGEKHPNVNREANIKKALGVLKIKMEV